MAQNGQNCNLLYYNYQLKYMCLQQCRKLYKSVVYAKKERRFDEFWKFDYSFMVIFSWWLVVVSDHSSWSLLWFQVIFVLIFCAFSSFLCSLILTGGVPGHFCAHCCGSRSFCAHCCGSRPFPWSLVVTFVVASHFCAHSINQSINQSFI